MNGASSGFAQAWIVVSAAAGQSAEYRLARRLLDDELTPGVPTDVLEIDDAGADVATEAELRETALDTAVRAWLTDAGMAEDLVLVVRDSWVVLAPGSMDALRRVLIENDDVDCVVPLQPHLLPPDCSPTYQTPRGLEEFHHGLTQRIPMHRGLPEDHRPALLAIRASALRDGLRTTDLFTLPRRLGERCAVSPLAYVHPLPPYHASDRADILPLVPRDTRALLDIGCGTGAFAVSVKRALGCRAVGLEMMPAVAAHAAGQLDRVVIGDALMVDLAERFDCITMLESLEHVAEPDRLMSRASGEWLRPGGHLIVSVPNVGHWSVVADQLAGRWDYVPAGLLCETHVRFFTEHALRALLRRHSFEVAALHRVELPAAPALRTQLTALAGAGLAVDGRSLDTLAFHVVARHVD